MAQKYLTIGWERLHDDARLLAAKVIGGGPWQGIVAITRGGLVPAAIIARELDCRLIECVSVVTYEHTTMGEPRVIKPPAIQGDGEGYLIVDDLVDSGTTARVVKGLLPAAHFACLYAKPAGEALADTFVTAVPQEVWLLFPWDTAPQFVPPLAQRGTG